MAPKHALWNVSRECYLDKKSPLYGSRPVLFLHDEIITEVPDDPDRADAAAKRQTKIMIDSMQEYIKDVNISAGPCLMRRWYKSAKSVYDKKGRIIPWESNIL